ncbi:MAG: LysR family transcriptional regulator [Bacteroidales bacterium]
MTLDQLRVFVTVARLGHVTRAGAALNLTQSAVSAAIAALEGRHGTQLFHRIGRGIRLTAEGALFLSEAEAVLARAAAAERALTELSGLKRGALRLFASQTIAAYWLPPLLHRFHLRHPGIALELRQGNTAEVAAAVAACSADMGFVEGIVDNPALVAEPVATDEMVLVVGAHHPWAGNDRPARTVLDGFDWILRERGSGTRQAMEAALAGLGLAPERLRVALELPSNEAVCGAVAVGAGATVISRLVAEPRVRLGELAILGPALASRSFCALRPGDRRKGRAEEALLALIREG